MTAPIATAWQGEVCTVTLNRPASGNSLSADLVAALHGFLTGCVQRPPRLLVLRGEGRHFCTGFDLAQLDAESDDSLLARFCRIELLLQQVHRAPFPTLAIAHGRTMGAGADLFAACTHRLAAPGTQFAFPGASGFGLVLGTRRLAHRVGAARAAQWVTTGTSIALEEALAAGLANGVIDDAAAGGDFAAYTAPPTDAGNPLLASALAADDPAQDHTDLALLVRSAAVPGLKARIAAYIERGRTARH